MQARLKTVLQLEFHIIALVHNNYLSLILGNDYITYLYIITNFNQINTDAEGGEGRCVRVYGFTVIRLLSFFKAGFRNFDQKSARVFVFQTFCGNVKI